MDSPKKVFLINPPNDTLLSSVQRSGTMFPLGLLSIASYLHRFHPEHAVEIVDGQITSQASILDKLNQDRPELIGLNPTICSYRNALEMSEAAKSIGAKVIFGGVHATELATTILEHRSFVDAVVLKEGEIAFSSLLREKPFEKIHNLAWRQKNNRIRLNTTDQIDLNRIPSLNFDLIDLRPYYEKFRKDYPDSRFRTPISIYTQKGCTWRAQSEGCLFCSRGDANPRFIHPKKIWKAISAYQEKYKTDYVMDVVDDFLQDARWFESFVESKPNPIQTGFMIYTRANRITKRTVRRLTKMNCHKVLIGMESGNQKLLNAISKGITVVQNKKVGGLLKEQGMTIYPHAVLGLPGETGSTLKETIELMEHVCDTSLVEEISANILIPLPGSRAFQQLNTSLNGKYNDVDNLDLETLKKEWVSHFCDVDYETIQDTILQLNLLSHRQTMKNE